MKHEAESADWYMSPYRRREVLISGAGFAGLASAWWMNKLGFRVTIVEAAGNVKRGGTPVDIRDDDIIDVVRRMGIFDQVLERALPARTIAFLDFDGRITAAKFEDSPKGWEIERDDLLDILLAQIVDETDIRFNDSIVAIDASADEPAVSFAHGPAATYDLVLGCDGARSNVRRLSFGSDAMYLHYLGICFSLTIVDRLLIETNCTEMMSGPGRTATLSAYNGKTDIGLCLRVPVDVAFERRDRASQKRLVLDGFEHIQGRMSGLMEEIRRSSDTYFDAMCQVRMPSWRTGRVALVGDAGYCPSPAAGFGGSIALFGAAAVADSIMNHPNDIETALDAYDVSIRPRIEAIQMDAVETACAMCPPDP